MKTFTYVEDYLEVINGDRDPATGKLYGLFNTTPPIISLARYDVQILSSMSSATQDGKSLTDKQAELAIKIILKYRKQLEKLDINVAPVENAKFRLGIRQIDRRRMCYIQDEKIILKFPYDTKLIDNIRDLAKLSEGKWYFVAEPKVWQLAITETNVIAAHGFATNNQFEISDEFKTFYNAVLECERTPYEIKLCFENDKLKITNAHESLTAAINNFCGFDKSNIDILVDNAPIYGYRVDDVIEEQIINTYNARIYNLMTSKDSKFSPQHDHEVINDVIKYAKITGRYPIYVYEPDMSDRLLNNFVNQFFEYDQVHRVNVLKSEIPTVHKKIIYFNKYHPTWQQPIPLLISGQGMMHGGEKSLLLQQAEKVVYFATEVYNNKKTKPS